MTYRGTIVDGRIVLESTINLPDGTTVTVEVHEPCQDEELHPDVIRFTGILPRDIDALEEYRQGMESKHR